MKLLVLLIAAFLQGIIEWLPVSSQGVLLTFLVVFGFQREVAFVLIFLFHLPTAFSALLLNWKRYSQNFTSFLSLQMTPSLRFILLTVIGTSLSGIPLYFLYSHFLTGILTRTRTPFLILLSVIGGTMILAGLFLSRRIFKSGKRSSEDLSTKEQLFTGIVQGLATIPGISRSGVTTSFLLGRKIEKQEAVRESFYIAVPAILGAFLLSLFSHGNVFVHFTLFTLLLSMSITFVTSLFFMKIMLKIARKLHPSKFLLFFGSLLLSLNLLSVFLS